MMGRLFYLSGHSMVIDEEYFSNLFKFPSKRIFSFSDIVTVDIEDMQVLFSTSKNLVKVSNPKREVKFRYQLLDDIVDKGVLAKAGSLCSHFEKVPSDDCYYRRC